MTLALPDKPVFEHPQLSQQHIAVSIRGSDPWSFKGTATFFPPYVPELNEYYGRELHYHYAGIRSEPRSIWQSHLDKPVQRGLAYVLDGEFA